MAARLAWMLLACILGLSIGFVLASGGFYVATQWSEAVVISDVRAAASIRTVGRDRWVEVHYHLGVKRQCPSWTQHTLYRDTIALGRPRRVVVPIGITMNGLGEPGGLADFDISFQLPDDLVPGSWYYVARTANSCEWLPGLVRQQLQETEPIEVVVPRGKL